MKKTVLTAAGLLVALQWAVPGQAARPHAPKREGLDAKAVIGSAWKALGSEGIKSIEYTGSGTDFALGQAPNPTSPWPRFVDKSYKRGLDFDAPGSRLERVRAQGETPPRGGGGQPIVGEQTQTQVVAAGSPQSAALNDELVVAVPQSFLRAAAAASDVAAQNETADGKKQIVITFTAANKASVHGYLNDQFLVEKVTTQIDNPVLGDVPVEADFSDYQDFSGVKFPAHIVQKQGGYPVLDLTVTDVKRDVAVDLTSRQRGGGGRANAEVSSKKLAEGVYAILGGYTSLAVEFNDHIVIVEGGQNDQRSEAVIAEAKRLIPNKPIQFIVNTHAHFDHAGGLRAFVAEGATVITQSLNAPYFQKVWANPHTLNPDRLAKNPKEARFQTVDDTLTLDGEHPIQLYRLHDFGHNDGTLIAYLPKEKVLVEADGFNPPAQALTEAPASPNPYTVSLVDNIERLKLDVETVIPIHYPQDNRTITKAELYLAAGRK